uniref:ATP synthase subunit a n=1 Tax=Andrena chekiangensis TaxID=2572772 RepID=A0A4D6SRZ1_9HYME|nr:ATP synthase F0 subunit 6 [Andrena chekiangensis]QCG69814.1 ATP synthase F0 subunit 6 [Andrena chekiangensis]
MMTNLFSIFDPSTSTFMSLNWISLMIPLIMMSFNYWMIPSRINMMWIVLNKYMFTELKMLMKMNMFINLIIFISLMKMIMMFNIIGLYPYIFTPTSHLNINLTLSLSLWISFMIYGWLMNTNKMFTHLVPMNTPTILMTFMVLIESISNIIRPWTLAIRLTANMLAGHLLLSLLGSSMNNFLIIIPMLIIIQNMLFILEISVAMIQSYVFSILSTLYFNESN